MNERRDQPSPFWAIVCLIPFMVLALVLGRPAHAQFPGSAGSGQLFIGQGAPLAVWRTMNGDCTITANGLIICTKVNGVTTYTGLPLPVNPADAATKQYVDSSIVGVVAHPSVRLATAAALPANVYNNGAGGVGATLTASANGALSIDGVVTSDGNRVLVKDEAATPNNGIYDVTSAGNAGIKYILTRSADANTVGTFDPNKIGVGSFVLVTEGNTQANTGWTVNTEISTLSLSPILWVQFSGATGVSSLGGQVGAINCGTGMTCAALTISGPTIPPQGRLTLQSNTPVMTTTQANKTTLYYDCFHGGNTVPVFNGTRDVTLPIGSCEISTAMQASSTGVLNTTSVFDVWAVNVSGTLTLCIATDGLGKGWDGDTGGSNTVRGTGYAALDSTTRPYLTNANTLTNCYNGATDEGPIAANQATFLGDIYTTAAGQTTYQFGNRNGLQSLFGIWNSYNRVPVSGVGWTALANYSYPAITWREAAGASHVQYVYGLNETIVRATGSQVVSGPDGSGPLCANAIGVDTTATPQNTYGTVGLALALITNDYKTISAFYAAYPGVGLHIIYMLEENASGSNVCVISGSGFGGIQVDLNM